jgi:anaerobic dimethyl sulfoxide reductase subunit B (iron-sulfur subunit)
MAVPITKGLLVNLDRCIGCYACEVACKQEHGFGPGVTGIVMHTVGPVTLDGELAMDFVPQSTQYCDLCADRVSAGGQPACADICPTEALQLAGAAGVLRLLRSNRRLQACKLEQ